MEALLHSCRGRIDPIVPDLISCTLMRLERVETRALKTLLYSAVSSAIHYDPVLAMQVLEHRQASTAVLTAWANHLSTTEKLRAHDLKVGLLAAASLLSLPNASAPPMVASNRLHLLRLGLTVHNRLEAVREQTNIDDDDEEDVEADDDDDDDDDDDLEEEELDDDEEGGMEISRNEVLARMLRNAASASASKKYNLASLLGGYGDDDYDEDELSGDEDKCDSAIDKFDELVAFAEAAQVNAAPTRGRTPTRTLCADLL